MLSAAKPAAAGRVERLEARFDRLEARLQQPTTKG
jgi:hypothetical protein